MVIASDSMTTICSHCERDVPTTNIDLHYAHCSRNLQKCLICGEFVPIKNADEHFQERHAPINCSLCSETIERECFSLHQDEECPKRIVTCEFCEFPLPAADLHEHQDVCGNRTELCHICSKYIRLRELITHEYFCQAHSNGVTESSGSWTESVVESEEGIRRRQRNNSEISQRSDDANDSSGEAVRRREILGSSRSKLIYTITFTGIAMLIGSFFLSRRS